MPEELLGGGAPPAEGSSEEQEALEDEVTEEAQEVVAKRTPEEPTAREGSACRRGVRDVPQLVSALCGRSRSGPFAPTVSRRGEVGGADGEF